MATVEWRYVGAFGSFPQNKKLLANEIALPVGFMSFPLACGAPLDSQGACNVPYANGAYTHSRINTVLDHHMIPYPGTTFWQYGKITDRPNPGGDAIITAFDGETVGTGKDYKSSDPR